MSKPTLGNYTVEPPDTITINGVQHFVWPVITDEGQNKSWDGTGIALVILPVADADRKNRKERAATAVFLSFAPELYKFVLEKVAKYAPEVLSREDWASTAHKMAVELAKEGVELINKIERYTKNAEELIKTGEV